jgi:hypothetical protein
MSPALFRIAKEKEADSGVHWRWLPRRAAGVTVEEEVRVLHYQQTTP